MKNCFFAISIIIIIMALSCSPTTTGQNSNAQIVIQAPDHINPPLFSINTSSGGSAISQLNTSTLDQNCFRYEITVESRGKRLSYQILSRSDKKAISVISGIPLDIFVGVYYSVGSSSNEEKYNVFLASASVTDFEIMSGESKNINLTLNLTNKQPVDTYFDPLFGAKGFAEITGGAIATSTNPVFSIKAYNNINSNLISYMLNANFGYYQFNSTLTLNFTPSGRGVLTSNADPTNGPYLYLENQPVGYSGFIWSALGDSTYTLVRTATLMTSNGNLLSNITSVKIVSDTSGNYYYFLIYNNGYFGTLYNGNTFNQLLFIDTTNFNNIYPADPFILDIVNDLLGTRPNNWFFVATKTGLFYVDQPTLDNYAAGNFSQALDASKKLIMIQNSNRPVLITNVAINGNRIYLGTKQGIYYLDENSSSWTSFVNSSNSTFNLFDSGSINKFALNEPIERLFHLTDGSTYNYLVASTPKQIYFYNLNNGRSASITVWDGFPFIPAYGVSGPSYNGNEYNVHDMVPVNAVIWDSTNSKFWFATTYGLASINLSSLGL